MKILTIGVTCLLGLFFVGCNNMSKTPKQSYYKEGEAYDPEIGLGPISVLVVNDNIDPNAVEAGKRIYNQKCSSCHDLSKSPKIGPGWEGITRRHTPVWIMNYLLNTEEMEQHDPEIQQLLAKGMVRMPDQDLTAEEARQVLEFMRQNDRQ